MDARQDTVTRLCARPPAGRRRYRRTTGNAGSVLMFHGNLVHASPPQHHALSRKIVYLTLCACSNHITIHARGMDRAPRLHAIEMVEDDALVEYARAHRVAAE